MSTRSFVDALIGLAREHKRAERAIAARLARQKKSCGPRGPCQRAPNCMWVDGHPGKCRSSHTGSPTFGHDITKMMKGNGYFTAASAEVFGDAIEELLQSSTPERKKS